MSYNNFKPEVWTELTNRNYVSLTRDVVDSTIQMIKLLMLLNQTTELWL